MVTDYRSPTFFDRTPIPNLNRFYRSLENRGRDDKISRLESGDIEKPDDWPSNIT